MRTKQEEKETEESHTMWADGIIRRTQRYEEESNWYPFMKNIEDVVERIEFLDDKISHLANDIGETQGMIKNLRKVLIKLELVDDRFVF
tara:strand:- start:347 stop:613 length:267 start_codon:yes stop_codon:yes gene_type:complete